MVTIQLPHGRVAFTSDEDACLAQHRWHVRGGYVIRRDGGHDVRLQHEVALRMSPEMHKDGVVRFYDRNPLNCQRDNLSLKAVRLTTAWRQGSEQCQAVVSREDFDYLNQWAWRMSYSGYVVRSSDGMRLHHLVARRMGKDQKRVRLSAGKTDCRRENVVT